MNEMMGRHKCLVHSRWNKNFHSVVLMIMCEPAGGLVEKLVEVPLRGEEFIMSVK